MMFGKEAWRIGILWGLFTGITGVLGACNRSSEGSFVESKKFSLRDRIPQALVITSGVSTDKEPVNLAPGVAAALHAFHRSGVPVRLAPRDILWNPDSLDRYAFLVLSTAEGFHDADRPYSLSYMTDAEMEIIAAYVKKGGILIAGDNVGRNDFEGNDRILKTGKLEPSVYPLAEVLGYTASEHNLRGFEFIPGKIFSHSRQRLGDYDLWTPLPDSMLSPHTQILARWTDGRDTFPAVVLHPYGKGLALSLTLSGFLNPAPAGGMAPESDIFHFYRFIDSMRDPELRIRTVPWPGNASAALALTFNLPPDESIPALFPSRLQKLNVPATFFVSGKSVASLSHFPSDIETASAGYAYMRHSRADFGLSLKDIKLNEYVWNRKFAGFRFPYTDPATQALEILADNAYLYESSLTADNYTRLEGADVPFNLVVSEEGKFHSLPLWEFPPVRHDDYFFLGFLRQRDTFALTDLRKKVSVMRVFLRDYWKKTVLPVKGMMVFIAHPSLSGYNDLTFSALDSLIRVARNDRAWITDLHAAARHMSALHRTRIDIEKRSDIMILHFSDSSPSVKGFGLRLNFNPESVKADRPLTIRSLREGKATVLLFDSQPGLKIYVRLPEKTNKKPRPLEE